MTANLIRPNQTERATQHNTLQEPSPNPRAWCNQMQCRKIPNVAMWATKGSGEHDLNVVFQREIDVTKYALV